jgi:hypothetical protein
MPLSYMPSSMSNFLKMKFLDKIAGAITSYFSQDMKIDFQENSHLSH